MVNEVESLAADTGAWVLPLGTVLVYQVGQLL